MPNGAAGFYLLGRIYQLSNRHSAAIAYYQTALQVDPMLWSAYEELCALGADHEAQQYLAMAAAAAAAGAGSSGGAAAAPGTAGAAGGGNCFPGFAAPPGSVAQAAHVGGQASPTASSSFAPVTTPSVAHQQGSPTGAAPMSTAATKSGLGSMFSWMDSGRGQHAAASTAARVGVGMVVWEQDRRAVGQRPGIHLLWACSCCCPPCQCNPAQQAMLACSLCHRLTNSVLPLSCQGIDSGGTPSPGGGTPYVTPSPGGRITAPPPPAPKGAVGAAGRPAWPATASPAALAMPAGGTTGGFGLPSAAAAPQRKFMDEGKLRKVSGKLFAEPASVLKQLRWPGGGGGDASGGGSLVDVASLPGVPHGQRSAEGQAAALPLLHALGVGYRLLCMYRYGSKGGRGSMAGAACCPCCARKVTLLTFVHFCCQAINCPLLSVFRAPARLLCQVPGGDRRLQPPAAAALPDGMGAVLRGARLFRDGGLP